MDKPVPEEMTIRSDADTTFDPRRPPSKIHEFRSSYSSPHLLLLWEQRALVRRAFVYALLAGTVVAILALSLGIPISSCSRTLVTTQPLSAAVSVSV